MQQSILLFLVFYKAVAFNPFADDDLFTIQWAGSQIRESLDDREIVTVQTADNEKYQCVIPESQASLDSRKAQYNGPSPHQLMKTLFTQSSCSYRIESYWTYELCHGKHVKQYHESKELGLQKSKLQEFYLGRYEQVKDSQPDGGVPVEDQIPAPNVGETLSEEESPQEIQSLKIDGIDLPFFLVNMTDGTKCDLTKKPRQSHVKYICQPTGRGEIYSLKETSSCEYDIIVLTSVLCQHPNFKPKDPPVSKINCYSTKPGHHKPVQLTRLEMDQGFTLDAEEVSNEEEDVVEAQVPQKPPVQHRTPPTPQQKTETPAKTVIGTQVDKQLLREFLNGDYCLHGGGGWWKHEFCFNKYAKQYHEEVDSVTSVYLGHWDKQKHLEWLVANPSKRPKPPGHRKQLSVHYQNGDVCDLTGLPRHVEVKLKCLNRQGSPHAVSIYLVEPKPCEYILGVESPIFCGLLDQADEYGLLENVNV